MKLLVVLLLTIAFAGVVNACDDEAVENPLPAASKAAAEKFASPSSSPEDIADLRELLEREVGVIYVEDSRAKLIGPALGLEEKDAPEIHEHSPEEFMEALLARLGFTPDRKKTVEEVKKSWASRAGRKCDPAWSFSRVLECFWDSEKGRYSSWIEYLAAHPSTSVSTNTSAPPGKAGPIVF